MEEDIITNAGVNYGIVETICEVTEALFPVGETKVNVIDGETVYGYDTRDEDRNYGAITGSPEDFIDNPYLDGVDTGKPTAVAEIEETRYPFEQLSQVETPGRIAEGGDGDDLITQAPKSGSGGSGQRGRGYRRAGVNHRRSGCGGGGGHH